MEEVVIAVLAEVAPTVLAGVILAVLAEFAPAVEWRSGGSTGSGVAVTMGAERQRR